MTLLDFDDRRNRKIPLKDISEDYLAGIHRYVTKSTYYPRFHIAPPHGLMNDPNGLCQIDGWYHVFYQWFPLGPVHGLKHWYHLKTRDFIHYVDFGPALIPDTELDLDGCFSGVAHKEGDQWYLYYTGVRNGLQQVCKAAFDGENHIHNKTLCIPHDSSLTTQEFRDPFLYQDRYILVGAQNHEEKGIITVFEKQGDSYLTKDPLTLPDELSGYMLECPNMLSLDDNTDLLIFSPMGIESPDRYTYRNVFSVAYGIGKFQEDSSRFDCNHFYEIDHGFDFYAPQIFRDEAGRIILLGWFGNSKCVYPSDYEQWAHMMTLPRQIFWEGDVICQKPLDELTKLRNTKQSLTEDVKLENVCFELSFLAEDAFEISIYNEKGECLIFGASNTEYYLDRSKTSHRYNEQYGSVRYAMRNLSRSQNIRVFVDCSGIEVFAEDGYVVFTSRFYLDDMVGLTCEGIQGDLYYLDSIKKTSYVR